MRVKEFDIEFVLLVWIWIHTRVDKYDQGGYILSKSDVGDYGYGSSRPHEVTRVDNATEAIPSATQTVEFGDIGKVTLLQEGDLAMTFDYGPDDERWHSQLTRSEKTERETVYAGTYERITSGGTTREFYYLDNGVVIVRQNGGTFKPYAIFADEQGSVLTLVDKEGNRAFEATYDAWGRQTVTTNSIGFTRGYTGHEMLTEFGIINMGGRLYDPVLGRFYSPDNYIQEPTNSQNFNRYTYCLNNPLKYTDPTGEMISPFLALAIFNVGKSIIQAASGKGSWKTTLLNIASAAATYGIGQAFGAIGGIGHELLRAGAHGLSSGVFTMLGGGNFGSGFVSGALASVAGSSTKGLNAVPSGFKLLSSAVAGGIGSYATGGDFIAGAVNGMRITLLNHFVHSKEGLLWYHVNDETGKVNVIMPEVVCTPKNVSYLTVLISRLNGISPDLTAIYYTLKASKKFGAKVPEKYRVDARIGSNGKVYQRTENGGIFKGNKYVQTVSVENYGSSLMKCVNNANLGICAAQVAYGGYEDYLVLQETGEFDGYNTVKALGKCLGAYIGGETGFAVGGAIGTATGLAGGGIMSIPVGIVLSASCGFVGAYYGAEFGEMSVDYLYGKYE